MLHKLPACFIRPLTHEIVNLHIVFDTPCLSPPHPPPGGAKRGLKNFKTGRRSKISIKTVLCMVCSCFPCGFPSPMRFRIFFLSLLWTVSELVKRISTPNLLRSQLFRETFVSKVSVIQMPNFSWGIIRIKADPNYLDRLNWFRRRSQFQPSKIQKEKNAHFGQTSRKIHYSNSLIRFGTWKVRRLIRP